MFSLYCWNDLDLVILCVSIFTILTLAEEIIYDVYDACKHKLVMQDKEQALACPAYIPTLKFCKKSRRLSLLFVLFLTAINN